jgi:two-component system, cell cycle sensor histidine kinase and response regulator CckA
MNPHAQTKSSRASHFRVLLVDDNPAIHADFRKIICPSQESNARADEMEAILFAAPQPSTAQTTFELESAHQGQEALHMLKRALAENRPYALAFVDVRMPPGWDGIETISHLWEVYPRLQIVVCTAYSDYSWDEMHAKLGHSDNLVLLKKPFDNVEVQQLTHALTRKWELNLQAEMRLEELEAMVCQRTGQLEQANQDLTRSEERFAKAFHTSPVAMAIQSLADGRFVDVNARMTQLTGCSREEMVGCSAGTLFIWNDPKLVDEWFAALQRQEIVRDQEIEVRHTSGNLHQALVSLSLVQLAGQPHALLAIQDVTERNLLERQLRQAQKMEAIGQLAAGVAHDFNNVLTVIQGHAGLIQNQLALPSPLLASADKITKAVDRASSLIRQLLMFSRKQVMKFRYLDLNEIVNQSLGMVGRLVGEHIRLEFVPGTNLPSMHADATMMEQVIMNLAVNARDAMSNGGHVTITTDRVRVQRDATPMDPVARDGQFVRLSFRDDGCGMDTTVIGHIFEPFFTTKAVGKGTGLGLSTVFGIVRQHNGWLEVISQPGQGSVFQLHFPACSQPAERTQPDAGPSKLVRGRETVLVAEDEASLREMVVRVLTMQGYKVLEAASGVDAIGVYERATSAIDLLMTDMVMPGGVMGSDLAERLRAENPKLKVIFTSGYSPGMAGKDISAIEQQNFLPKPYSISKLAHFVREVLDQPVSAN